MMRTASLRLRLYLLVALLACGMLFYSIGELAGDWRTLEETRQLAFTERLSTDASALIHELQKERGLSAGFIGSKGARFVAELEQQRRLTQSGLDGFARQVAAVRAGTPSMKLVEHLTEAQAALAPLDERRSAIDRLALPGPQSFAFYTAAIEALLDVVAHNSTQNADGREAGDARTVQILGLHLAFISAKEFAGRERATLNAAFAANTPMDTEHYARLMTIIAGQSIHLQNFAKTAPDDLVDEWKQVLDSPPGRQSEAMRRVALERHALGSFAIEPAVWFKVITEKIDAMKRLEDRVVERLGQRTRTLEAEAVSALAVSATLTVLALVVIVVFARLVANMVRRLDVLVAATRRLAEGSFGEALSDPRQDEVGQVAGAFEAVRLAVQAMSADAEMLTHAAVEGRLATRADATRHQGDYRRIVQGVNDTLDAVIGPLNVAADYVDRIAKGDIPAKISDSYQGDFNTLKNNLNTCIEAVNALVADANLLSRAAVEGKLATRADATRHQGDFRMIVQGVNDTLDAVIGPLNVAARYVDDISRGELPAKIADSYKGDFNTLKNNLNACIEAISSMVAEAGQLERAAIEGRLATRADVAKYQGDYRRIVQGVNNTLDAVIGPLNVAANYVDRIARGDIPEKISDCYQGDFNAIKNNLNTCIDAVNALVADAELLAAAAVAGRLETRADAGRHQGDFRKIVEGVNATLDRVVDPVNDVRRVMAAMSAGDMTQVVTARCQGDFDELKNAINAMIDRLVQTIGEVRGAADTLSNASSQVSATAQSLSQSASEQASSVEQTTASMAQMTESISRNTANARVTDTMAAAAAAQA